ncbi:MAG: DNA mismatch repair protein MutS [Defluviitaleaceae bacterium]|nr:DNA mismatch repair protein MutS [Defluviitaleaceae bacterium]
MDGTPKLTPMMEQYHGIKAEYADCLLMYRLGDFYELFFNDALVASKELDIALTARDAGGGEKAPMCGVPHHAANNYIAQLIEKGYKVAICEQTEDPKLTKKLVKREVVRIITAGTILDSAALDSAQNNYIACVYEHEGVFALAYADVTTGEFSVCEFESCRAGALLDELVRLSPKELLANKAFSYGRRSAELLGIKVQVVPEFLFDQRNAYDVLSAQFGVKSLAGFGLESDNLEVRACGALIGYLSGTLKSSMTHMKKVVRQSNSSHVEIDHSTRRNLEIIQNLRERTKKHSLLWVMDRTKTAMGARTLRKWVQQPLRSKADIERRQCAVERLKDNAFVRSELRELLGKIYDFERIVGKIVMRSATPVDIINLRNSFADFPRVRALLAGMGDALNSEIYDSFDEMTDIFELIERKIIDNPPPGSAESGFIKDGEHAELDKYRNAKSDGASWLSRIEATQRVETGIKSLRIRHNKVFGYYIEVTNSNLASVPERYIRKQTLANCERFTIPELSEAEEVILSADEQIVRIEREIFAALLDTLNDALPRIQLSSAIIATIDVLSTFSEIAEIYNYNKPIITVDGRLSIINGRHPVVERLSNEGFVPNDTVLDLGDSRVSIITGPNMAGKSTYMRQVALIVLMAQMGAFVPADSAQVAVVDKVFARVGASDDLAMGQSTFMTEMTEVANIVNNATSNSLIVLDEIGRGTSTYDGLSIAWAVIEHIAAKICAKTLCATHYHELTKLEDKLASGVKNYSVSVQELGDDIVFLRKIVPGGTDRSYGIHVARLAGLPSDILDRATDLLDELDGREYGYEPECEIDEPRGVRYKRPKHKNYTGKLGAGYIMEEFGDEIAPDMGGANE